MGTGYLNSELLISSTYTAVPSLWSLFRLISSAKTQNEVLWSCLSPARECRVQRPSLQPSFAPEKARRSCYSCNRLELRYIFGRFEFGGRKRNKESSSLQPNFWRRWSPAKSTTAIHLTQGCGFYDFPKKLCSALKCLKGGGKDYRDQVEVGAKIVQDEKISQNIETNIQR